MDGSGPVFVFARTRTQTLDIYNSECSARLGEILTTATFPSPLSTDRNLMPGVDWHKRLLDAYGWDYTWQVAQAGRWTSPERAWDAIQ